MCTVTRSKVYEIKLMTYLHIKCTNNRVFQIFSPYDYTELKWFHRRNLRVPYVNQNVMLST